MATHADPTALGGLPQATATEYLSVLTTREDLNSNPDARLMLYRDVCATLSKHLGEHQTGCSPRQPADQRSDQAIWISVLLTGAQDAWSSVRRVCIDELEQLLSFAFSSQGVQDHLQQDGDRGQQQRCCDVSSSVCASVAEQTVAPHSHVVGSQPCQQEAAATAAEENETLFVFLARELLTQMKRAWESGTAAWYQKEGLLRVYKLLFRDRCPADSSSSPAQREEQQLLLQQQRAFLFPWRRQVLLGVVLPALSDPQLPVRECAVELLCTLIAQPKRLRRGGDTCCSSSSNHGHAECEAECEELARFAANEVVAKLQVVAESALEPAAVTAESDSDVATPLRPFDELSTRTAEGYLLAVVRLCSGGECSVMHPWEEPLYPLLCRYAAHPASSVRQYVAEALGQSSDALLSALLDRLLHAVGSKGRKGCDDDHNFSNMVSWQATETLLMALQQHLVRYLSLGPRAAVVSLDRFLLNVGAEHRVSDAKASCPPSSLDVFSSVLRAIVDCAEASRFEVARMGTQVLPLFLQFWVRYAPCVDEVLLAVVAAARAGDGGGETGEGERSCGSGGGAATVEELAAPAVWWFTAIRVAAESTCPSATAAADVPFTLPSTVTSAWRALLARGGRGDAAAAASLHGGFFATRLAVASYFSPDSFPEDPNFYHDVAAPLLGLESGEKGMWKAVLAAPKSAAAERLQWGLDFVFSPAVLWGASDNGHQGRESSGSLRAVQERVLPLWLAALPGMMTHQQCILLCMARAIVCQAGGISSSSSNGNNVNSNYNGSTSSGGWRRNEVSVSGLFTLFPSAHRLFSFVYRPGLFAAPVTLDGGEDVVLGYTWLKAFFPQEDYLPILLPQQQVYQDGDGNAEAAGTSNVVGVSPVAAEAILQGCGRIYVTREVVVEPVVLRETRLLLMALARYDRRAETVCSVVDVVLARLDTVLRRGQWWLGAAVVAAADADADADADDAVEGGGSNEETSGNGWDDWDDDDDDDGPTNVGAVEGIAFDEELHEAAIMVKHLWRYGGGALPTCVTANIDEKVAFLLRQ